MPRATAKDAKEREGRTGEVDEPELNYRRAAAWPARARTPVPTPSNFRFQNLSVTIEFHAAEAIGSDRSAQLSHARGGPAGDAVYADRRQAARSRAVSHEVEEAFRRGSGAADVGACLLGRARAAGADAYRFVRRAAFAVDRHCGL